MSGLAAADSLVAAASAKPDGHDGVAALGDEALDVGGVVVLAVGLDRVELDAELVGRLRGALEARAG